MKLSTRSKFAREGMSDIDYIDALPAAAKQWLEVFLRATLNLEDDAIAILEGPDGSLYPPGNLRKALFDEQNAARRDVAYVAKRLASLDDITSSVKDLSCPHCYRTKCKCSSRQRHSRYSEADYLPYELNESDVVDCLDVLRRADCA